MSETFDKECGLSRCDIDDVVFGRVWLLRRRHRDTISWLYTAARLQWLDAQDLRTQVEMLRNQVVGLEEVVRKDLQTLETMDGALTQCRVELEATQRDRDHLKAERNEALDEAHSLREKNLTLRQAIVAEQSYIRVSLDRLNGALQDKIEVEEEAGF